jgi:hypothetical protein
MSKRALWKKGFAWLPEYVENGDPKRFGWKWLTPVWYVWFEGCHSDYWMPATHKYTEGA